MKKTKLAAGLLAFVIACLPMINSAVSASAVNLHDEAFMTEEEKQIKEYCDIIINLSNNERCALGLSELATFPLLNEVTCLRATELAQVFDHVRPDGTTCFTALKDANIFYRGGGENIAAGRPEPSSAMSQWLSSPKHKANILTSNRTHIGIGYYYQEGSTFEYYWSMFLIKAEDGNGPVVFDGQYIPTRSYGDADGDHDINSADARFILRYAASRAAGVNFIPPTGFLEAADINKDGDVNAWDAASIMEYSAAKGAGTAGQLSDYIWQ